MIDAMPALLGTLAESASVIKLSCGPNFVVAVGLCGQLRAWQKPAFVVRLKLAVRPGTVGAVGATLNVEAAGVDAPWTLVLSDSSMYELPHGRKSSHPYVHLSAISPAGRFVAATIEPRSILRVFDTTTWTRVQTLDPVADEGDREEWSTRGLKSVHASLSCLELAHGHLACGTREGMVRLWRADAHSNLTRRHCNLIADYGPVAAVVLTAQLLIAAYRQSTGFNDGNAFTGLQSTAAWSLSSGQLLWCFRGPRSPCTPPVLGAVSFAEQLVLLHADTFDADAEWNLVRPPAPPTSMADAAAVAAAEGALLMRTLSLGASATAAAMGSPQTFSTSHELASSVRSLPRAAAGPERSRLLTWHSDGKALALGFAAGAVTLATAPRRALFSGPPREGSTPYVLGAARGGHAADVAHVHVLPLCLLGAGEGKAAETVFAAAMLVADAAGHVRAWAMRLDTLAAAAAAPAQTPARPVGLEALFEMALGPARQPCSLGLAGRTIVCGCADGSLHARMLPMNTLSPRTEEAAPAASNGSSSSEALPPEGVEAAAMGTLLDATGVRTEYEWTFDTGAGAQARGKVNEKRRSFDGWARTAAYEVGLQAVLAKMQSAQGKTGDTPWDRATTAAAHAAARAAGGPAPQPPASPASEWARGMRVRLQGLVARPELNGAIGVLLGEVEVDSGRAPVKLMAPPEHAGKTLKTKRDNMICL